MTIHIKTKHKGFGAQQWLQGLHSVVDPGGNVVLANGSNYKVTIHPHGPYAEFNNGCDVFGLWLTQKQFEEATKVTQSLIGN